MDTVMRLSRGLAVVGALALVLSGLGAEGTEAKRDGHRHGAHSQHRHDNDKHDKKRNREARPKGRDAARSTSDEVTEEWFRFFVYVAPSSGGGGAGGGSNPTFVNVVENNPLIINGG